jgi:drug/metabolite transporter (DMT)-like permease
VAGVCLGLHFATWISSLAYTSVASSVVLVSTSPLFVGLTVRFLLKEQVSSRMFVGIVLATMGAAIIGWGDFRVSGLALWGDVLAIVGAIMVSAYFLIGRSLRQRLSLLTYVTPTYWLAALVLGIAVLVSGQQFSGFPPRTYLMFLLLAVGPQVVGHSSLNWALRYLSPTFVTAAVLGEPIGSTILAHLVLHESPSAFEILGGIVILAGIYVCSRAEAAGGSV